MTSPIATAAVTLRAPEVRTFAALEFREAEASDDHRYLEGRAVPYATWANIGWFMEQHAAGSFARSIKEAAKSLPLLLWHDNRTFPVGVSSEWRDNGEGLDVVWRMDKSDEARRAAQLAEDGMLTGLSIGFAPIVSSWDYVEDPRDWNPDLGPDHMDKVTRTESRLLEVSLTPTPAFAGAKVSLVRSREARKEVEAGAEYPGVKAWRSYRDSIRRHA